ncbi:MAG: tetraacyldisaccharide 4'-kinase [Bryobacteraceae bacterium]
MKTKAIYLAYRISLALAAPFILLYFLWRRSPQLGERLGFLARSNKETLEGAIWLHAVSVGEVLSLLELVRQLRDEMPRVPLYVSTTTAAGHALAQERLRSSVNGIFYSPIDFVFAVRRVLRTLRPSVVVVLETEIWPNLYREVKRAGCGLLVVNARISDRARPRYLRWRWFFRHVLLWPDRILAQSAPLAEAYLRIGAPAHKVKVGGNLKYDLQPPPASADLREFLLTKRSGKIWIAASTMPPDEDDLAIEAFQSLARPDLLLILAPRKPERFEIAAKKLKDAGIAFTLRSALGELRLPGVLLLDSIGELAGLFAFADVVFMGGSLVPHGGHNILEPAFAARPIITGPHMQNFREMADEFRAAGALREVRDAAELAEAVAALLDNPGDLGRKALACAEARRGATATALHEIRELHAGSLPRFRPVWPLFPLLALLAQLWKLGLRRSQARQLRRRQRLALPVIAVGNLTMGGAGKTPFVLHLAKQFSRPGILTRGYGRRASDKHLILEPGMRVSPVRTGDEPQLFLRAAVASVGIGADRFTTGKLLERRGAVDALILDDGFQHLRLERCVDIVLIDGLKPFGGGELFPLGRLREPLAALSRADILVVTRSDSSRMLEAIERCLRRHNHRAPVFRARTLPEAWVEAGAGRRLGPRDLPVSRVAAFCGLGNPDSFWSTLDTLSVKPVYHCAFGDHHRYTPGDLRRLAEQARRTGAEAFLTTEKDAINLFEGFGELLAPLPLFWLEIGVAIEDEPAFRATLDRHLAACR